MRNLMMALIVTLGAAGVAHSDDYYVRRGYDSVARAAHAFEDAARHFHRQLKYDIGRHHMTKDAKRLAKAARHFHRQVERGGSYRHLREDYADVARAYGHLRHEFGRRHGLHHDRHLRVDFRAVERAFYDLDRAMYHAVGHARARDRDRYRRHHDRYERRYPRPYDWRDHRYRGTHQGPHSSLSVTLEALLGF